MEKFSSIYISILLSLIKYASTKSIDSEKDDNSYSIYTVISVLCIGVIIIIFVSGGFCLFSKKIKSNKKLKNIEFNQDQDSFNNSRYISNSNENKFENSKQMNEEVGKEEKEEYDGNDMLYITPAAGINDNIEDRYELYDIKVQEGAFGEVYSNNNTNNNGDISNNNNNNNGKRKSFLGISIKSKSSLRKQKNGRKDSTSNKSKNGSSSRKDSASNKSKNGSRKGSTSNRNSYQIQIVDDRSINSISTNEDWIFEQKYQAHLKHESYLHALERGEITDEVQREYNNAMENYDNVSSEISNDGFWSSELEPIQTSSNTKEESYAVPSLGAHLSTMIIMPGGDQTTTNKRQSIIIVDDDDNYISKPDSMLEEEYNKTRALRPTRVTSWKDKDLSKEISELLKGMNDKEKLMEEAGEYNSEEDRSEYNENNKEYNEEEEDEKDIEEVKIYEVEEDEEEEQEQEQERWSNH